MKAGFVRVRKGPVVVYRALSLKQPWAALLVHGVKTIEIRRWSTRYSGPVLIHAAKIPDRHRQPPGGLPPHARSSERLSGGIIGVGVLAACVWYGTSKVFEDNRDLHLNDPSWFEPGGLFGFRFRDLRVLPFTRLPGNNRLFKVNPDDLVIPPGWQEVVDSYLWPEDDCVEAETEVQEPQDPWSARIRSVRGGLGEQSLPGNKE